jgi:hypothetical protein
LWEAAALFRVRAVRSVPMQGSGVLVVKAILAGDGIPCSTELELVRPRDNDGGGRAPDDELRAYGLVDPRVLGPVDLGE